MLVREIMKAPVSTIQADDTVTTAARRMRDDGVGCLPVLERDRLVGIVTDRDLVVRCLAADDEPEKTPVSQVMSIGTVCCRETQTEEQVRALMQRHGVMRLPVVDRDGTLIGLISQRDLRTDLSTKQPHKVSFYKDLMSSDGHHRQVPVHVAWVTGVGDRHEAEAAAQAKLESERRVTHWSSFADGFTVEEPERPRP